ncbi:hypothetical protein Q4F19_05620 [Sphingomonas sp. BIUV-7]|uniref:Uncharacterized protein n=2 Tax=Sphingomonas natans TaxID=3063330 RepID=A0ABT8Y6A2_9SPHN|nr:hypothetical protein [Sphingomonas sp. BIUV-7]
MFGTGGTDRRQHRIGRPLGRKGKQGGVKAGTAFFTSGIAQCRQRAAAHVESDHPDDVPNRILH